MARKSRGALVKRRFDLTQAADKKLAWLRKASGHRWDVQVVENLILNATPADVIPRGALEAEYNPEEVSAGDEVERASGDGQQGDPDPVVAEADSA